MSLSVNRENGELDRLREANDLNRDGSVRYPARGVSKRRKRQNPKYCRMLGIQPREKIRFGQGQLAARRYSFGNWLPKTNKIRTVLLEKLQKADFSVVNKRVTQPSLRQQKGPDAELPVPLAQSPADYTI